MTHPTLTIGTRARYTGSAHESLYDAIVEVVAVHKGYLADPDRGTVLATPEALAAHGGLDPARDLLEVAPLVAGRRARVTYDCAAADLLPG